MKRRNSSRKGVRATRSSFANCAGRSRWQARLLASGAVMAFSATTAHAQEATPALESSGNAGQEIIVTARKRQESALKVPVVATIIGSETIERASISDLDDIAKFAPGLQIGESVLSIGTQVSLR